MRGSLAPKMYLLSSKDKIYTTESSKRDLKWSLRRRPKWAKGQRTTVSTKTYLQTLLALGLCWVLFWSHMKTSTEKSPLDEMAVSGGRPRSGARAFHGIRWFHIPASVGIGVLAFVQIRRMLKDGRRHRDRYGPTAWQVALVKQIPAKGLSRAVGRMNHKEFPPWVMQPILRLYVRMFGCKMHEAEIENIAHYRSLSQLFRRKLKPGARMVNEKYPLVSPCDGTVLHYGKVTNGLMEQVKGITYSLGDFLGPGMSESGQRDPITGQSVQSKCIHFITIYLAPGDYHHFHSPAQWTGTLLRHFPGQLLSVAPWVARFFRGLFSVNERVVLSGKWEHGSFTFTAVGAFSVGSIDMKVDKDLQTNAKRKFSHGEYHDKDLLFARTEGYIMNKGDHIGGFNFGSTIVLAFEAPEDFKFLVQAKDKVKYGEALGSL